MNAIIKNNQSEINKLCEKFKVNKLYLFGSILSENFNPNSDIDFLVDLINDDPGEYSDNYFNLLHGFEKLFNKEIDLITTNSLKNPYFIDEIDKNKYLIYG